MPTSSSTVVLVPVLRRPGRVELLARSLAEATPEPHRLLFLASTDDAPTLEAIEAIGAGVLTIPPQARGDYPAKINHGYRHSVEPFLFLGADDLRFHPGWLSAALAAMDDPAIGVVGTQDLAPTPRAQSGEHATHFLVRRSYADDRGTIDVPGEILHPGYWHEFVDDELIATARARHAWTFAPTSIDEHLHPSWGKAETDALYSNQPARMRFGRTLFARRRRLWN